MIQDFKGAEFDAFAMEGSKLLSIKDKNLENVVIPQGVTEIGYTAFESCFSLKSVDIPDSVTEIGRFAFFACSALETITIPDSVTIIAADAFWGCSGLHSVTIQNSDTQIGKNAFGYCSALLDVSHNVYESLKTEEQSPILAVKLHCWDTLSQEEQDFYMSSIRKKRKLKDTLLRSNLATVITIFLQRKAKLKLEDLDVYLQHAIAEGHTEITAILLEYKNKHYSLEQLNEYTEHKDMIVMGFELPTFSEFRSKWTCSKRNGVLTISGYKGDSEREVIPHHLADGTPIKFLRMKWCSLEECIVEADLEDDDTATKGQNNYIQGSQLKSVTFTQNLKKLPSLSGCQQLEYVSMPDSITQIVEYSFFACISLQTLYIPDSVTEISDNAFYDCKNLTIQGKAGSYVETYCKEKDIPFVVIS